MGYEHSERTHMNFNDVLLAFRHFGIKFEEIKEFLSNSDLNSVYHQKKQMKASLISFHPRHNKATFYYQREKPPNQVLEFLPFMPNEHDCHRISFFDKNVYL